MKYQRGLIQLSIFGYTAIAVGVVIAGLSIALKVYSSRLDAVQQENKALAQQVSQWQGAATQCSDGVEQAKKEAETRLQAALAARRQAEKGKAATDAEIARLKSQKPSIGSVCLAGEAVAKIKAGIGAP